MKHLSIWAILVVVVLLAACNRYKYRDAYTGNFQFTTIRTRPDSTEPDSQRISYAGYVDPYGKDAVFIRFKADDSIAPAIDKAGVLTVPGFVVSGGTFTGSFSDEDNMHFETEFTTYLHERVRYDVTGVRR